MKKMKMTRKWNRFCLLHPNSKPMILTLTDGQQRKVRRAWNPIIEKFPQEEVDTLVKKKGGGQDAVFIRQFWQQKYDEAVPKFGADDETDGVDLEVDQAS
jgi:hypothetical protein